MLESMKSNEAYATAAAVPFPVTFKEHHQDRTFKQVAFPGGPGTYRVRTINSGLRTVSTILQKSLSTGITAETPEGQLFRLKAVLSEPDAGVNESYWLTMKHEHYGGVQSHNQYRMRGVSLEQWKSDYVYSEARDEANHIIIYEMLHDLLSIIDYIEDDKIEAFLQLIAEDAFKSIRFGEKLGLSRSLEPDEFIEHTLQEKVDALKAADAHAKETLVVEIRSSFSHMAKLLRSEFRESFLADKKEFTDLMRMYRMYDRIQQNPGEVVSMVIEVFLEEYIDRVVKSSNLEVLLENDENKAIYLEGRYELDVKAELLNAAFTLMPHDSFVFHANSTVKLLIEPVSNEQFDYGAAETVRDTLALVASQIYEVLQVGASEEISKFLKLLIQEIYVPYALVDLRSAIVSIDLDDMKNQISIDDGIVEFDTFAGDDVLKTMVLRDMASNLLIGSDVMRHDFEIHFIDRFLDHFLDQRKMKLDYEIAEYLIFFSEMGERFAARYKETFNSQESIDVDFDDAYRNRRTKIGTGETENLAVDPRDLAAVRLSLQDNIADMMGIFMSDMAGLNKDLLHVYSDVFDVHYSERIKSRLEVRSVLDEYYRLLAIDGHHLNTGSFVSASDEQHVSAEDQVFPIYKPHLQDKAALNPRTHKEQHLSTLLIDHYQLPDREKVMYALGDVDDRGWPIGTFILGTNTLKGKE